MSWPHSPPTRPLPTRTAGQLSRAREWACAPGSHLSGEHDEGGVEENQVEADCGLQVPARTGWGAVGVKGEGRSHSQAPHVAGAACTQGRATETGRLPSVVCPQHSWCRR